MQLLIYLPLILLFYIISICFFLQSLLYLRVNNIFIPLHTNLPTIELLFISSCSNFFVGYKTSKYDFLSNVILSFAFTLIIFTFLFIAISIISLKFVYSSFCLDIIIFLTSKFSNIAFIPSAHDQYQNDYILYNL